ncbi:hypothetical protein LXA43DRAFT_1067387 [Ganoderma leucocontextum]|nr:hypothetical protein LXA43DRAFT_1067387 [Ganoderma leucocontextum]
MQDLTPPKDNTASAWTRKRHHRKIRTLDPAKLIQDDYIDFSSKCCPTLRIILRSTDPLTARLARNPEFHGLLWSSKMYPPGTHGFMYYHTPPSSSPLAGELRFRVTPSRDPASFATGSDLLTERGIPWRYPLYKIVCRPNYRDIVALLLQDGLVSQQTLDLATAAVTPLHVNTRHPLPGAPSALSDTRHPALLTSTPVLSAFGQEFDLRYTVDLNCLGIFAGPEAILTQRMRHITTFRVWVQGKPVQYCPFEGSVVCCFERSTLPEHVGRRVVVIRVKRFIDCDPIRQVQSPDGHAHAVEELRPREGELLKTVSYRSRVQPWAADVDKLWNGKVTQWKALRVLFENEELYGSPPQSDI